MPSSENTNDTVLQIVFVLALFVVVALFYWTRIVGIKASTPEKTDLDNYANSTAFQLEQEENAIKSRIRTLKVDYTNELLNYRDELARVNNSLEWSELEKKEKLNYLNELYSEDHFRQKQDLIDQENKKLERVKKVECIKFCTL